MIAEPLGLFDCCGVSDGGPPRPSSPHPEIAQKAGQGEHRQRQGAAALPVERLRIRPQLLGRQLFSTPPASPPRKPMTRPASGKPREQVSMFECHDCFSITEMVTMEDLQLSPEGGAINDVMDGFYDADGQIPLPNRRRPEVLRAPTSALPASACSTRCTCSCRAGGGAPVAQTLHRHDPQLRRFSHEQCGRGVHCWRLWLGSIEHPLAASPHWLH